MAARTSLRPAPTPPIQALNKLLAPLGDHFVDVSFETFASVAERVTRLDDWGGTEAIGRFRRIADALEANENLSPWGRISTRIYLQSKFANHLLRVEFAKRHPEVHEVPIEAPIVIFGWYRTGTTLLHNLLSADPRHRVPRAWEVSFSVPFVRDPRRDETLRRAATGFLLNANRYVVPEQASAHYIEVGFPEECFFLFENAGCSTTVFNTYQGYDYAAGLLEEDLRPVYEEHKLQLQILSLARPRQRWVLKCPFHLWALDPLLEVYPDAKLVQTHRDVRKSLPSNCSLSAMTTSKFVHRLDLHEHGRFWDGMYERGLERGLATRRRIGEGRIADVRTNELSREPVSTVRGVYEALDLDFDADVERRVREEASRHPKDVRGAHVYAPEDFGLDPAQLASRYADYHERFGLIESPRRSASARV